MIRRRRTGERGAAFTEFLAIVPAFIAVNVALAFLFSGYAAKRTTISDARQGAWTPATKGCQGAAGTGSAQKTSPAPDSALQGLSGQVAQAKQAAQASQNLKKPFDNLTLQASGAKATKAGRNGKTAFGDLTSGQYSTENAVVCNEVPQPLNPSDEKTVVDDAWKKYVGQ